MRDFIRFRRHTRSCLDFHHLQVLLVHKVGRTLAETKNEQNVHNISSQIRIVNKF